MIFGHLLAIIGYYDGEYISCCGAFPPYWKKMCGDGMLASPSVRKTGNSMPKLLFQLPTTGQNPPPRRHFFRKILPTGIRPGIPAAKQINLIPSPEPNTFRLTEHPVLQRNMKMQRWNDWLLLFAIVCFVCSPLGNIYILSEIEGPAYRELDKTYDRSTSRPGHFMSGGVVYLFRLAMTVLGLSSGILLAVFGSIRIPRSATATRKLRDITWVLFIVVWCVCLAIYL